MSRLLPDNFDSLVTLAIIKFWKARLATARSQEGSRGAVIGGKNLDGFCDLIGSVAMHCGMPRQSVIISGKGDLTIPGFFRPTKMWDALVIHKHTLVAAFELKSQVGSFGNNFNNRAEESLGSAQDFRTAFRERVYYSQMGLGVQPFLGYLMLLEDCVESAKPVGVEERHFRVLPEFRNSSYRKRYQILCEKLVTEQLYSSACLMITDKKGGKSKGMFSSPSSSLSPKGLFTDFAAKVVSVLQH
jgi:hypothetical protein